MPANDDLTPDSPAGPGIDAEQVMGEFDVGVPTQPATLVRNSAWGLAAAITATAVSGGVSIYAIRSFSQITWGRYSTASSIVAIFVVLAELGLSGLVLREMAARPEDEERTLGLGLRAVFRTAGLSALVILPVSLALGFDRPTLALIALGIPLLLFQPLGTVLGAAFNAHRLMLYAAQLTLITVPLSAVATVGLIMAGVRAPALVIGAVLGTSVSAAAGIWLLKRRLGLRPVMKVQRRAIGPFIRRAMPIALVGGIGVLYDRIDVVILSRLGDAVDVAHYSVAYALAKLAWVFPSVVGAAFFPVYARLTREDPPRAAPALFLMVRILAVVSGSVAFFLTFGGRDLLTWVFGARYADSAVPLAILGWVLVTLFESYVVWYAILAARLERRIVRIQIASLLLNIAANVVLIPELGAAGAALAFLISDSFSAVGQFLLVHRRLHPVPVASIVVAPIIAAVPAVVGGLVLLPESSIAAGIAAAMLYALTLQARRYVTVQEWAPLTDPAKALTRRLRH